MSKSTHINSGGTTCTVFFDGACPVCSKEIATYQKMSGGDTIDWVDASTCDSTLLGEGLERTDAMQRLHVRDSNGKLISGAAAFIEIWKKLPAFAWLAPLLSLRPVLAVLEFSYRIFLVVRRLWRPRSPSAKSGR
jgi:ubiquinone biosynthesis monooxygenase Coq7